MKWINKGEEFSTEYQMLQAKYENSRFFIYGAGMIGGRIADAIRSLTDWKVIGFIDQDDKKNVYKSLPVMHWEDLTKDIDFAQTLILIGLPEELGQQVKEKLVRECAIKEENCITYTQFVQHDFPIVLLYGYNKVFLDTISMIMTEACNLKCKDCAIMLPYFIEHRNPTLEKLQREADALFAQADFVGNLTVTGGEPLLRKELAELLGYIGENYRKQIGSFKIITNGILSPRDELLEVMKQYDIAAEISDYTNGLPEIKEKVEAALSTYRNAGIQTYFLSTAQWVDFGFRTVDHSYSEEELIKFFDYCHTRCRGYVDGKIRYCINAYFASKAMNKVEDDNNAFDILEMEGTTENRRALVEFDMGYSDGGYLKMCQHCNGTVEINTHYIEVGVQCKNH